MRKLFHITLSVLFCMAFSASAVYAGGGSDHDHEMEDYLPDDQKKAVVDDYKNQYLNDGEIDLGSNASLHEHAAELDEKVEYPGEKEQREKESKTVYKYNKEVNKSPEEYVPRLWVRP